MNFLKKGFRVLGIAECSDPPNNRAILAGVVMRGDLLIDGVALAPVTLWGLDATDSVLSLSRRKDIQLIMLRGVIISYYNIIDLDRVHEETGHPVIGVVFQPRKKDIRDFLKTLPESVKRTELVERLGEPVPLYLKTGYRIFAYLRGIDQLSAEEVVNSFAFFGRIPEPVRVARLFARAYLDYTKKSSSNKP